MAYTSDTSSAADIEREIAEDRRRIEDRLDAIQQRMSPGQLVDQVLTYAKTSGGGEYASNLGAAVKNNPVPMALVGVGLAWLMAGPKTSLASYARHDDDIHDYPLATIQGDLRRAGPVTMDNGQRYSHFTDGSGSRYKALTDEAGKRAGHFMDESGKTFRGFADASGRRYHDLRDEAGNLFDDASGWVSDTWRDMKRSASKAGDAMADAKQSAMDSGAQLNTAILKHFRDQPLVGGALAFAVGAAIGAALPHTQTEDDMLGTSADNIKSRVLDEAAKAMDKVEDVAADVRDKAVSVAAEVHDVARDRITEEAGSLKDSVRS